METLGMQRYRGGEERRRKRRLMVKFNTKYDIEILIRSEEVLWGIASLH